MKKIIYTLNFFLFFFITTINSYIYEINAFKTIENKSDNKKCIIGLGDIHYGSDASCCHPKLCNKYLAGIHKKQAKEIIDFAKKYKNSLIIVEDIYDYNGKDKDLKKRFKEFSKAKNKSNYTCCLEFINNYSRDNEIPAVNVEYRQPFWLFVDSEKSTAGEFLIHIFELVSELEDYQDEDCLNEFYHDVINDMLIENEKFLSLLEKYENRTYKYLKKKISQNMLDKFTDAYFRFIDAKILHIISQNHKMDYIFVCAGNDHIKRIKKVLNDLRYKNVKRVKNSGKKEYSQKPADIKSFMNEITKW